MREGELKVVTINQSFISIVNNIVSQLLNSLPSLDTKEGSPGRTIFVEPVASQLQTLYYLLNQVYDSQSISTATGNDLDTLGANVSIARIAAVKATGIVTFSLSQPMTNDVIVNVGTIISTPTNFNSTPIQFQTLQALTIPSGQISGDVAIESTSAGSTGNVAARTITTITTVASGINGVINNESTTGGTDVENDVAYRARIRSTVFGNDLGTEDFYRTQALNMLNVKDVIVITANAADKYSRGPGCVELILKGETPMTSSATMEYESGRTIYSLPKQPVLEVPDNITGIVIGGTPIIYQVGTDWIPYEGPKIKRENLENSIYGSDGIEWLTEPSTSTFSVDNYMYDANVENLETSLENTKLICADILVREGEKINIDTYISFTVLSGYDWDDVSVKISDSITQYLDTQLSFGAKLEFSDLAFYIRTNVLGIDNIKINEIYSQGEYGGAQAVTYYDDILFDSISYLEFANTSGLTKYDNLIVYGTGD